MTATPEAVILARLAAAVGSVAQGAAEALTLLGPMPADPAGFAALDLVPRTAARALVKAVEQQQDLLSRLFRTLLLADAVDLSTMTARDIANRMEKLGALADAGQWSALARLRNRLAHEYPVEASAQLDRVRDAAAAVPLLEAVRGQVERFMADRGYLS